MNEPRAVLGRAGDDTAQSPKRKKVRRQKYAPKACVSCRRSKLKCSGENPPCQRCLDSGKRCFYSEDQTAAEALQTLSRPPAVSPLAAAHPALARSDDGPALSMEARMARMEALMQAVLHNRATSLPRDDSTSDNFVTDLPSSSVCYGARTLAFPTPADYQRYCALFFSDLNLLYPGVDEASFRASSAHMLAAAVIPPTHACLLALHYIIFACVDILHDSTPSAPLGKPPGWQWFHLTDELVGKRPQYGCGDVSLVQVLLFQSLYFTFAEQPSLAYSTIGMASRLALQHGLHRRSSYTSLTAAETNYRLRIFWNVYIADRRISLSCRRPYSMRESDADAEWPAAQETYSDSVSRNSDADGAFIACMIHWSHLAGFAWDRFSAATASHSTPDHQGVALFDVQVTQYIQDTISKLTENIWPDPRVYHIYMSLNDLRLLVARPTMLSLQYAPETARICSSTIADTISRTGYLPLAGPVPSYRRHAVSSLASALLTLCALLVRAFSQPEGGAATTTSAENHTKSFRQVLAALHEMASALPSAQRLLDDFGEIISLLSRVIDVREGYGPTQPRASPADIAAMIPHNVLEMFPYRDLNPVLYKAPRWTSGESSLDHAGWDGGADWREGERVLWI